MEIIRGIENIPVPIDCPVLTIGNFDGVHLGHQVLFKKVAERARETGGTGIALTFEPHPRKITAPEKFTSLLTTLDQKLSLIEKTGIDIVICADFTPEFASQNPAEFTKKILVEKINVKEIIAGHDFSFGKGREGTTEYFQKMGSKFGFKVDELAPVIANGDIVSSSLIRNFITAGHMKKASDCLRRHYSLEGKVVEGCKKGSSLGFPTANIDARENLVPGTGVYAVQVEIHNKLFKGVANVGYNPTFKRNRLSIEAHIFDFNKNLYDEVLKVSFIDKIRDETEFLSAEKLKAQIQKDKESAKEILKRDIH